LDSGVVLVTSGLGGVYPRGLPIGTVIEESDAQEGWNRSYWLLPFVYPGLATHVQVLVADQRVSLDANEGLEDGPVAPGPAAPEESARGIVDAEVRQPR